MKKITFAIVLIPCYLLARNINAQADLSSYPSAQISNKLVKMKLFLPDPEKGSYRATRFDWSGIITSLEWEGHQYFGEWKTTHDPLVHEDLSGPAEASGMPGMGYAEAPVGGKFIRLGVGVIEKPDDKDFQWAHTYKIVDPGKWTVTQGKDWIEFRQEVKSDIGYGYTYTKKISLKKKEPGFIISHSLENTGTKSIEIDQYNHNFFRIDAEPTGRNFQVTFPFNCTTANDTKGIVKLSNNQILFEKDLTEGSVFMEVKGFGTDNKDNGAMVINNKTGAGIKFHVDRPLYKMNFWACTATLCPENYILIKVEPGKTESWNSEYTLFKNIN